MKCPACYIKIIEPIEPTDEAGAEFKCKGCRNKFYLGCPGGDEGTLSIECPICKKYFLLKERRITIDEGVIFECNNVFVCNHCFEKMKAK